jgi:hypothetical protein
VHSEKVRYSDAFLAVVISLSISAANAAQTSDNWATYSSPDAVYSALFPLTPKVMSDTSAGGTRTIIFGGEQFGPKHMIFQVQVIEPADPARIRKGQTSCPASVVASMDTNTGLIGGQVPEYRHAIALGDVPGRETLTLSGRLWVRQRYFCDGKRMYIAQTFSDFKTDKDPDADRFLNSFHIN